MKKLRFFDSLKFVRTMFVAVACVFILNVAHAATLPAGYTELEYIESTGTQYIDTGYIPNSNTRLELDNEYTDTPPDRNFFNGVYQAATGYQPARFDIALGVSGMYLNYGASNVVNSNTSNFINTRYMYVVDAKNRTWAYGNVGGTIPNYSNMATITKSLYLFARNDSSGVDRFAKQKTYSSKIYDDDILVQDLIPARRDSDGVLGMYDLADANPATAFHTNAGTGEFVAGLPVSIKIATTQYNEEQFEPVQNRLSDAMDAVDDVVTRTMSQAQAIDTIATTKQTRPDEGCDAKYCLLVEDEDGTPHWYPIAGANGVAHALPTGYTELQYIESTGTQYIDTGIVTQNGIGFDVTFLTNNSTVPNTLSYGAILGGRVYSGDNDFQITTYTPTGSTMGTIRNGPSTPVISAKISTNTKLHISLINDVITYDDGTTSPVSSYEYTTGKNIYLFGLNNNGSFTQSGDGCRIYNAKLLVGSNVVFDGIPAKQGTTVGMYDLVSGQFFTNAGTGTFTAGPDM